jgi:predicted TIM-barrel fold metal-dependent hydrolase
MVIDFSSTPPGSEFAAAAPHLANYRRVYRPTADAPTRGDDAGDRTAYLAMYERLGARAVVIKARDLETTFGLRIANEDVAAFCRAHGTRYIGFAGVDPHKGMAAIRELEHAVRVLGLRGLNLQCFEHRLAIDDRKLYPLYAKCIELDIPVNIHASINFSTDTLMEYGHPRALDAVMVHFPELRVCAAPPGWPWVQELIGVAWRHRNVSIGLVAVRPKVLAIAQSGYGPLLQYGDTLLRDRIIFGSSWPMMDVGSALAEIAALPLKPETRQAWLHDNAARFLRLDG